MRPPLGKQDCWPSVTWCAQNTPTWEPIPDSRWFFTAGSPSRPGESCSAVHGHTSACGAPSQRGIRNVTALTIFGSPGYGAPLRSSHGPCVAADARGGPCTDGVDHI
jgi:hypothetical protein